MLTFIKKVQYFVVSGVIVGGLWALHATMQMPCSNKKVMSEGEPIEKITPKEQHASFDIDKIRSADNIQGIVIIGSGCAGLSAAVYGARNDLPTLVIKGNLPLGLLSQTTDVENWPGEKSILGPILMGNMLEQAEKNGVQLLDDVVESIDTTSWPYKVTTSGGHIISALTIIIATGAEPKRLGVEGEETYWGAGVTACAICDAAFFKGEDVVVVGGGDSAVEEATILARHAKKVTILIRKDQMRAAKKVQKHLKGYPNVFLHFNVEIKRILGDGSKVTGVELFDNKNNKTFEMPTAGVFLAVGHQPNSAIVEDVVTLDDNGYILMKDRSQATSKAGIFAAGDVEDSVYRQAIVAAGSGVRAALDATRFLTNVGFDNLLAAEINHKLFKKDALKKESIKPLSHVNSLPELEKILANTNKLVVVDFYTEECSSCKFMMPMFEELIEEKRESLVGVKVDAGIARDIATKYMVNKVPCFLIFKDGQQVGRYIKVTDKKGLGSFLEQFLNEAIK